MTNLEKNRSMSVEELYALEKLIDEEWDKDNA